MDNERYSTWNTPTPVPRGEPPPSRGMPQSAGARDLPDLNFPPEDQGTTEEPSNPQHGPSNPEAGSSNPEAGPSNPEAGPSNPEAGPSNVEQDPPAEAFFRTRVLNPKPFFTGKVADALEDMRKLLVKMRKRFKHQKEGGTPKRKDPKRGQPKSGNIWKRTKRNPGDDMEM